MSTRDCRDVCPLIAIAVKQALEQLGARSREVTVLGASADPHGDIPAAVRRWLATLRMPNNFRYLIGGAEQLQPVWRSHYAAPQPRGNANRAHSASIWLIDRNGRWRTKSRTASVWRRPISRTTCCCCSRSA